MLQYNIDPLASLIMEDIDIPFHLYLLYQIDSSIPAGGCISNYYTYATQKLIISRFFNIIFVLVSTLTFINLFMDSGPFLNGWGAKNNQGFFVQN